MTKNVIVCCDGTSNEFSAARTNVAKLCFTLVQDESQVVYYHPGLGTMEPAGALTTPAIRITRFLGLAIGYGLVNDIRDAYVFLMDAVEPGDRVYMFGFSRGAYTVRALTALLYMYGLLRPGNEALVPYAIRMMSGVNNLPENSGKKRISRSKADAAESIWSLAHAFKDTFSRECKPDFVGLWDTVSSVGLISHPFHAPYTNNSPDIAVARQALALDERRAFFQPSLWMPKGPPGPRSGPRDLKQVWFPGDHCDVGGGHPENQSGLSKGALKWMVCEAAGQGLRFDIPRLKKMLGEGDERYVPPDPNGELHNSMKSFWPVLELIPKKVWDVQAKLWVWRINFFRRRSFPPSPLVHRSAFLRDAPYRSHIPEGATESRDIPFPSMDGTDAAAQNSL